MTLRVVRAEFRLVEVPFRRSLQLSSGREIRSLPEMNVELVCERNNRCSRGRGNLLASIEWAHPKHLHPKANSQLDIRYFSEACAHICRRLSGSIWPSFFSLEEGVILAAEEVRRRFEEYRGYQLPQLMAMMATAPFSIACLDALEKIDPGRSLLESLKSGALRMELEEYLEAKWPSLADGTDILNAIPEKTDFEWLSTIDLSISTQEALAYLRVTRPRQVKIKIEPGEEKTARTFSLLTAIIEELPETGLYFDANRSYSSFAEFNAEFFLPLRQLSARIEARLLGFEEILRHPFTASASEVESCGVPVFLDESVADIESASSAVRLGYGIALKVARPFGTLLIQLIVASKAGRAVCVQDLSCTKNAYFANFALRALVQSAIGLESNYLHYLYDGWREPLNAYHQKTSVPSAAGGYCYHHSHKVFPDENVSF